MSDAGRDDETERLRKRLDTEFEEFVSTAAHDLREPLRDVAVFSQLLAETYSHRLDAEAGLFLSRIEQGAAKMQSLLSGMVDYASGAGDGECSPTGMEAVLAQALLGMEAPIAERSAIVTHDVLPRVSGDFAVLTKILQHLIRNAIEYCDTAPPRIHISARQVDPDWVLSVRDNGPGIDPAFQERIFRPFKRLHSKEYPGHGLGLAYCKKAIDGLGGRMWVESTPGAGSTFYFTLAPAE